MGNRIMSNGVEDTQLDRMKRLLNDAGLESKYNLLQADEEVWLNLDQEGPFMVRFVYNQTGRLLKIYPVTKAFTLDYFLS